MFFRRAIQMLTYDIFISSIYVPFLFIYPYVLNLNILKEA
jgi:hypothetical protein